MEVRAVAKFIRVQPRKVRIVAAEVKGQPAIMSAHKLRFHPSKGARLLRKVLVSAIANAQENYSIPGEALRIARIQIDEGPTLKRITQRAQGRANRINKKMSHITVILEDYEPSGEVKPHGTMAKARPKFEAPKKSVKKAAEAIAKAAEDAAPAEVKEDVTEATAEVAETSAEATPETTPEEEGKES